MSVDLDTNEEGRTAGEAGSTSANSSSAGSRGTTSQNSGLSAHDLAQMMDQLLTKKLAELKPVIEEKPNTQSNRRDDDVKTYTEDEVQKRINSAIRQRLAEKDEQFNNKLEQLKTQWLAEAATEFERQKNEAIQTALTAREFETAKKSLQSELGLTDAQVARLQGKTVDELKADALMLGFVKPAEEPKPETKETKVAPNVSAGNTNTSTEDISDLAALVRAGLRD